MKVNAILFYENAPGDDLYLDVVLSCNKPDHAFRVRPSGAVSVVDLGAREKGEKPARPVADAAALLWLVSACCADYLSGAGPESMDTATAAKIPALSARFNWEGAGYGPETAPGERVFTLMDHITHFWCIG